MSPAVNSFRSKFLLMEDDADGFRAGRGVQTSTRFVAGTREAYTIDQSSSDDGGGDGTA